MKETESFKAIPKHLKKIVLLKKERHHPALHKVHVKHGISKKTLFYMKEYGPHSHVVSVICRESFKVLIFASIISSVGGIGLQAIQDKLFIIIPLLILIPAINNLVGDFGTIISSKFTTMLYLSEVGRRKTQKFASFAHAVFAAALIAAVYTAFLSCAVSYMKGYSVGADLLVKIFVITILLTLLLVSVMFVLSTAIGFWVFKRGEDPNNFLIPITTSVADLCSMALLAMLVSVLF